MKALLDNTAASFVANCSIAYTTKWTLYNSRLLCCRYLKVRTTVNTAEVLFKFLLVFRSLELF